MASFTLISAVHALILSVLLFFKKKNTIANFMLAGFILTVSLFLTGHYLHYSGLTELLARYNLIIWPCAFLLLPFLYFYTLFLTGTTRTFKRVYYWHFFPSAFIFLFLLLVHFDYLVLGRVIDSERLALLNQHYQFLTFLNYIQGLIYFPFIYRTLRRYHKKIRSFFSNDHIICLRWLRILVSWMFVLYLMFVLTYPLEYYGIESIFFTYFKFLCWVLLVFMIGYFGLWQPRIFSRLESMETARQELKGRGDKTLFPESPIVREGSGKTEEKRRSDKNKYQRNRLTDEECKELKEKMTVYMEKEKPFLEPDLTLGELGARLGVTVHSLSQVINRDLGMNFFNFINSYRVEEAKSYILADMRQEKSLLEISMEVGFNSKNTFINAFKKFTGMTPTRFRSRHNNPSGN